MKRRRLWSVQTMELLNLWTGYVELQWSVCGIWKQRQTDGKCLQNCLWDKKFCLIFLAGIIENNPMDTEGVGSQDVSHSPYRDCKAIPWTRHVMGLKTTHSLSAVVISPALIWSDNQPKALFITKHCVNRMARWMGVGIQAGILDWDVSELIELWTGLVHGSSFHSPICIS